MSTGFLEVLRFFLLALLWLFFIYAARLVIIEMRRGKSAADVAEQHFGEGQHGLHLRVLEPREQRGRVIDLVGDITLGRSTACVVPLETDTYASSVHARVYSRNGETFVEDLGSTNGTYLNEHRVRSTERVQRGDVLRVGRTVLEVSR